VNSKIPPDVERLVTTLSGSDEAREMKDPAPDRTRMINASHLPV